MNQNRTLVILLCALFLAGSAAYASDTSTWSAIQTKILASNCVSCHVAGNSFAVQSGLILTPDVAYQQLVGHAAQNISAHTDGLLRVGTGGESDLEKSFLWIKLNASDYEQIQNDHPYYGAMMPLGSDPLTNGQLSLIKAWISAGAPETGVVASESLLNDTTRFQPGAFKPLEKPEKGYQLHLGPFPVAPNFEREFFKYETLDNTEDIYVNKVEISMRTGSHHFILYTLSNTIPASLIPQEGVFRDIRDSQGNTIDENTQIMNYHDFVSGTQWPYFNHTYPPGVALKLPPHVGIDMNSHYVNKGATEMQGEIYANLSTVDVSQVEHVAYTMSVNNQSINLPPNKQTTLTYTETTPAQVSIFQMFSHAHKHMTEFKVQVVGGPRNGEVIYLATDWEHPPILSLDPPLVLNKNEGLKLMVTYNNTTDKPVRYGLTSEDEMMILFGAYYLGQATPTDAGDHSSIGEITLNTIPNPFDAATILSYHLAAPGNVSFTIIDMMGHEVASPVHGYQQAGNHQVEFDGSTLPAGTYIGRLQTGITVLTKLLTIIR